MAPFLRQLVAGPRVLHKESGLDLCYVTPQIIVTSGPAQDYLKSSYRNPLPQLLDFLRSRHQDNWTIWEFRAEGTGYSDEAVENRVHHYPWPDHQPPPFRLIPLIMASMRNWLKEDCGRSSNAQSNRINENNGNSSTTTTEVLLPEDCPAENNHVAIIHCKAGKGRSGTVTCSYLISECGWSVKQALDRFTSRRMKPGYGNGVSIPSQLRWIDYVDQWTRGGKKYTDRAIEIIEIRTWGLRPYVQLEIKAYSDEGKKIKVMHRFKGSERCVAECLARDETASGCETDFLDQTGRRSAPRTTHLSGKIGLSSQEHQCHNPRTWFESAFGAVSFFQALASSVSSKPDTSNISPSPRDSAVGTARERQSTTPESEEVGGGSVVVFKPETPVRIENNDVQVSLERRSAAPSPLPLNAVTSRAYVWFNAFFESDGNGESGVFEVPWEAMDGVRGTSGKGGQALDRMEVVWRVARDDGHSVAAEEIVEPSMDARVPEMRPADWTGPLHEEIKPDEDILDDLVGLKASGVTGEPLQKGKEQ